MPLPENRHPKEIHSFAAKRSNTPSPGDFPWAARNFRETEGECQAISARTPRFYIELFKGVPHHFSSFPKSIIGTRRPVRRVLKMNREFNVVIEMDSEGYLARA